MSSAPSATLPGSARPLRVLLAIARADFLERVRRYAFLITLVVAALGARGALPPRGAGYTTVSLDGHRALYGSAGAGVVVALITGVFLMLVGFYLVKNAVERDRHTGVGQVLAASPMGRLTYIAGKVLSNAAVLFAMLAVMLVVAAAMQQLLGEDRHVDLGALVLPFVFLAAPAMLVVAAVAVLFEVVPRLRGGLGNVLFFFLWIASIGTAVPESAAWLPFGDPVGMRVVMPSLQAACARAYPGYRADHVAVGITINPRARFLTGFSYSGVRWTRALVARRLAWVGIAALLTGLAALLFDRFDTARARPRPRGRRRARAPASAEAVLAATEPVHSHASIAALAPSRRAERLTPLIRAEVALLFKGQNRWWYAGALTLAALCLFVPLAIVRDVALPMAAVWPLLAWSSLGWRETRYGTAALLFSAPRPLRRQLLATWLAGVLLALGATGTYGLRVALAGDLGSLSGWLAGVLFIPSFALASGAWTGSGKLFEVAFLALWYVGPMQHNPGLDLLGAVPGAHAAHAGFFVLALGLLALAYVGRARELRS